MRKTFQALLTLCFVMAAAMGRHGMAATADTPITGMVGVGTWNTQADFADVKVTRGATTLYRSNFASGMAGWKTMGGAWTTAGGVLHQSGSDTPALALAGKPDWSDYTLTLRARKTGGKEGFLITFGSPGDATKIWWNVGGWGNTQGAIEGPGITAEQKGGVQTGAPSPRVPVTIEAGRWYDIKIQLSGGTVRAYLDNRLINSASQIPSTHTVVFSTSAPGKKLALTQWGLDTAWAVPDHVWRGLEYMGKDHVQMIRVSFPVNEPLVNGDLPASKNEHFSSRLEIAKLAGDLPLTMLPDTEGGVNPWYKNGSEIIPERWTQLIAVSQRRYGKKMAKIEPFNEADYGWGQGSIQNLNDILGALEKSPDFAGVQMAGPSTLNADSARSWYQPNKDRLQVATTHSLAGSMDSYINFYETAIADGKMAENPEVHNLSEVISGAEYGLTRAIWWDTAELARGEFVKAVQGARLAYAEDRARWTAAGVYRAPDGKVQVFLGASERMGQTTTYRFVSKDRPVFFNGDGPRREYSYTIPGGRNADALINITWGEDVPQKIEGRYVLVNRHSGKALEVAGGAAKDGADIQQGGYNGAKNQQWDIAPLVAAAGDQSYFTIRAVHSGKTLDTADWNHAEGGRVQQWGTGDAGAQHWYFDYAGDNYYYVRSRWSTECLGAAGGSKSNGAIVQQFARTDDPNLQWRLVPVSGLAKSPLNAVAPKSPAGLAAISRPGAVALTWSAGHESDLAGYTVLRGINASGPYDTIARGVTGNRFTDTDVAARRTYYYKVKAIDCSLNQSPASAIARATAAGAVKP